MPKSLNTYSLDIGDPQAVGAAIAMLEAQGDALTRYNEVALPRIANEVDQNIFAPMIDALAHYPPRNKGMKMRWKSEKQRKYVLMMLRKRKNLPYQRTSDLAKGWINRALVDVRMGTIRITTLNVAESRDMSGRVVRYQRFVSGDIGTKIENYAEPIQPFHADRGWQPAQPIIALAHQQANIRARVLYVEGAAKILKGKR